jgi:two-component system response regulator MprA
MRRTHVLLVGAESEIRRDLERALAFDGYEVWVASGEPVGALAELNPDVAIVDHTEHHDGLEFCRAAREIGNRTPILIVSDLHEIRDRVAGLDAGADDYLVNPFAMEECLARTRALLRNAGR